jgi:hypothetical protein
MNDLASKEFIRSELRALLEELEKDDVADSDMESS